jgi:hypothetical protein
VPGSPESAAQDTPPRWLLPTLGGFGFGSDEARYLESRLDAGALLIAVTTDDAEALESIRHLFADHDAVHIGLAQSDVELVEKSEALLLAPPERLGGGDVVVADVVAPLRRASRYGGAGEFAGLRQRQVIDIDGEVAGTVDDVVVEVRDPDGPSGPAPEQAIPRYLLIGHGGVLGIGRRVTAVPLELTDVASDPVRLAISRKVLDGAPGFDDHAPLSRREERAIADHFGVQAYWRDE